MCRSVYSKLPEETRKIVDAVHQTKKDGTCPTLHAIKKTFDEMSNQTVSEPEVLERI